MNKYIYITEDLTCWPWSVACVLVAKLDEHECANDTAHNEQHDDDGSNSACHRTSRGYISLALSLAKHCDYCISIVVLDRHYRLPYLPFLV